MTNTNIQTNLKNNLPIYVEQQIIQTDLRAQDILKTKIPIPGHFIKLTTETGNYCGSTNPKWKNKPLSARYGFDYQGEWITLDIPQALVQELDLPCGEDIPYAVYISPEVINRKAICGGITIESEAEIFIDRLFTKNQASQTELTGEEIASLTREKNKVRLLANKAQDLRAEKEKLLEKIKELEKEDRISQQTIINLQSEVAELETKLTEIEGLKKFWENEWLAEKRKANKKINNLTNERDDYQTKWDISMEELEQKEEIIRVYLEQLNLKDTRINALEREKNTNQQELTQKDNEITGLKKKVENLEDEKEKLRVELETEKGWWDKWINDSDKRIYGTKENTKQSNPSISSYYNSSEQIVGIEYRFYWNVDWIKRYKFSVKELIYEYYKNQP